jgi:pilus assembly protein CpaB
MNRATLTLGIALALLAVASFVLYMRRFDEERSGGEPVQIVAAKMAILRGKTITEEMLVVRSVPLAYVEERCVKAAEKEKILGLRVINPIDPGAAVMWSDFSDRADERRDLSSMIAPGHRAFYVKSVSESSTLIHPGDHVDVIATMPETGETRGSKSSMVLLQKVLVLAHGMRTSLEPALADEDLQGDSMRDQGLTLSLSLQQAQTVAMAATRGRISVALRSPEDERTHSLPAITMAAVADPRARAAIELGQYDPSLSTPVLHPDAGP